MSNERADREMVIIGSGPAGLTAAIYANQLNQCMHSWRLFNFGWVVQFVFNAEGVG